MGNTFPVFSNILIALALHWSYAGNPNCCEFIGATASLAQKHFHSNPPITQVLHCFFLLSYNMPLALVVEFDVDVPFRAGYLFSYALHFDSPLTAIDCTKADLNGQG